MVRSQAKVTSNVKKIFPNLASVVRAGTGLDSIDVDFCKANGISIYSSPGANAEAVSEYVIMMMLVALRKLNTLTVEDAAAWNRYKFRGRSLKNQSIGIVGYGAIGRLIYRNLRGFGCSNFYAYDPYLNQADVPEDVKLTSLDEVIESAAVITLHVPLTEETKYLIDTDEFDRMKPGAVLINASRGGIVSEQAAVSAAAEKGIVYVADVVEGEPQVSDILLGSDGVVVTPHIASLTDAAEEAMIRVATGNFLEQKATIAASQSF
jgi:D-3-phosphoglycerate dehydrogenase